MMGLTHAFRPTTYVGESQIEEGVPNTAVTIFGEYQHKSFRRAKVGGVVSRERGPALAEESQALYDDFFRFGQSMVELYGNAVVDEVTRNTHFPQSRKAELQREPLPDEEE